MFKKITFFAPIAKYKKRSLVGNGKIHNIRLLPSQYEQIVNAAKNLNVSPHYFMKWCVLGAAKAVNNKGQYIKINIFGEE